MAAVIKYIFWDFGDTLVGLNAKVLQIFTKIIFEKCSSEVSIADLKKAMGDEWSLRGQQDKWDRTKRVNTPEKEHQYYADFFKSTLRKLEINDCVHAESISKLANLKTSPSSYYVFPDALKTVNKLSKLGIKQAIISNGFHAAPEILKQSKLRGKFEFEIWSYEHGTIKPERKIYEIALEQAGCQAEEVLFIDDRKPFVIAAQNLGMFAIQIDRSEHSNFEQADKNSFPIINNLSAIEKYLQSEKPIGRFKPAREEDNLQIAL